MAWRDGQCGVTSVRLIRREQKVSKSWKTEDTGDLFNLLSLWVSLKTQVSYVGGVLSSDSTVKAGTKLTLDATLKAHKYSNLRQQRQQQHLCVYKTARSPVGARLLSWNMKRDSQ